VKSSKSGTVYTPPSQCPLREETTLSLNNLDGLRTIFIIISHVIDPSADWRAGLGMSSCRRILLSYVIFNRIKQHFELPKAELKITFDGFRFAVLHVRQVQHRDLSIEVRKCAIQRVE